MVHVMLSEAKHLWRVMLTNSLQRCFASLSMTCIIRYRAYKEAASPALL